MNISTLAFAALLAASGSAQATQQSTELPRPAVEPRFAAASDPLVQVAILLDTSGSMKGLIDQARCQFWNLVDELARADRDGRRSRLHVAVYEYGNSRAAEEEGYVRQVLPFSDDLDAVSRALFSLDLEGGDEFAGTAIARAVEDLGWDTAASTYRAVFIAGNEPFDQGPVTVGSSLPALAERGIALNTIYCEWKKAEDNEDVLWAASAELAGGLTFRIDHNHQLADLETPYDSRFRELNRRMNETFVWFGKNADKAMRNQIEQDENAASLSTRAFAARMSAKIGHLYRHVHSDLVDAVQHGKMDLAKMRDGQWPTAMRAMPMPERIQAVRDAMARREQVRREMATVISQRHAWLARRSSGGSDATNGALTWGDAFLAAIRAQAGELGYAFGEPMMPALGG